MAAPGSSPLSIGFDGNKGKGSISTPGLLEAMLRASDKVSDLIFSPGRPPQVEIHGHLAAVQIPGSGMLSADDTRRIAADLIGTNKQAITTRAISPTVCRDWRAFASMYSSSGEAARW
jgi:hypothetical protein